MTLRSELANQRTSPEFPGAADSRKLVTQVAKSMALIQHGMAQEGGIYTAVFSVQTPKDSSGNEYPFQAQAILRWSEGGNTVQRRISIVMGTSISIPGRLIDIKCIDATPALLPISGGATPGAGTPYTVTVIVERGTRAITNAPPTLYGGIFVIGAHATQAVNIPKDAGVISVEVSSVEATAFPTVKPNVVASFQSGAGIWKQVDPSVEPGFVTIPPGATEIVITNADGTNPIYSTVTWGVDG
jgi:hypothetical protein